MVDAAIQEFNETYPNVTVELERQQWDGLVERLTNVLPTEDGPDIFEVGNTQAQGFEAAGAMVDLTGSKDDLGGDDLLDSLVEAGTYDGKFYGVPLYAGARIVVYRTDLFEESGLEIPTTLEEFVEAGKTLQADNADVPNFSGIYFPGRTGTPCCRSSGTPAVTSPPSRTASGSASSARTSRSRASGRSRTSCRTPTRLRPTPTMPTTSSTSATARSAC